MGRVLVTGGTGVLGSRVAKLLAVRGHDVKVLSRKSDSRPQSRAVVVHGELRSARGLSEAIADVEAIVHCASSPLWRARATEVDGLRNLIDATGGRQPHLLYISIVGVDQIPYRYFQAKWEAERLVEGSGIPWTIQRATQFHSVISKYAVGPFIAAPKGARAQLIDASEVAERLVELVAKGPSGRVPDMGGPEILSLRDVARLQDEILGRHLRVLETPALGRVANAFLRGRNLCPDDAVGSITYADYLRSLRQAGLS